MQVKAGTRRDGRVEITSGLSEGDRIVSDGTVKLRGPGPVSPAERSAAATPAPAPARDAAQPAPAQDAAP